MYKTYLGQCEYLKDLFKWLLIENWLLVVYSLKRSILKGNFKCLINLESISSTFYMCFFRRYPFAKKSKSQTVTIEKSFLKHFRTKFLKYMLMKLTPGKMFAGNSKIHAGRIRPVGLDLDRPGLKPNTHRLEFWDQIEIQSWKLLKEKCGQTCNQWPTLILQNVDHC